jgi:hypothetical protein
MFDGFKHDIIKMSRRIGMNIIKSLQVCEPYQECHLTKTTTTKKDALLLDTLYVETHVNTVKAKQHPQINSLGEIII